MNPHVLLALLLKNNVKMIYMKRRYLALVFTITSCSTQRITTIDAATSFVGVDQPYVQPWVGGAPGSGSGATLYFPASMLAGQEFVASYFAENMSNTLNYTTTSKDQAVIRFSNILLENRDITMHSDPQKEYRKNVPVITSSPVKLKENQVLIVVKAPTSKKHTYILLDNLEQRPAQALPSRPQ